MEKNSRLKIEIALVSELCKDVPSYPAGTLKVDYYWLRSSDGKVRLNLDTADRFTLVFLCAKRANVVLPNRSAHSLVSELFARCGNRANLLAHKESLLRRHEKDIKFKCYDDSSIFMLTKDMYYMAEVNSDAHYNLHTKEFVDSVFSVAYAAGSLFTFDNEQGLLYGIRSGNEMGVDLERSCISQDFVCINN